MTLLFKFCTHNREQIEVGAHLPVLLQVKQEYIKIHKNKGMEGQLYF